MADVRPFRGCRYNPSKVKDLASVICPPYDIITPQMEEELYRRSEYNFVRLEFGRTLPSDTETDNRYTRAAAVLEQWLQKGVFEVDPRPAVYLHDYYFTLRGKGFRRRGMLATVRLEEWDKKVVRPHEGTQSSPKSDRLRLMWSLQANTSPVFALYQDPLRRVSLLLEDEANRTPEVDITDGGERHRLWAITDKGMLEKIGLLLTPQPLYIADGHHRYESALTYRRERRTCAPVAEDQPYDFVMMSLVDFADPGLVILPPHRLLRGIPKPTVEELRAKLGTFFDAEELPLSLPGVWEQVEERFSSQEEPVNLAAFGLTGESLLLLRLRDRARASQMMPYFHTEIYKKLDVSIIDHVILENLLGLSPGDEGIVSFTYDREEAVNRVRGGEYQLAFILKPIRPEVIKDIADAGDRMPRKSTYFYPKLPSGLVFYRMG